MSVPFSFVNPDSDAAREALSRAIQNIPEGVPMIGLVLKVAQSREGEERLVNYEFADPEWLRKMTFVLGSDEREPDQSA